METMAATTTGISGIGVLLGVLYLVAWFFTMQITTRIATDKGYGKLYWKLWFIGLFGFIFTPAIIAAALPDKNASK
jgi:hypothetical protein